MIDIIKDQNANYKKEYVLFPLSYKHGICMTNNATQSQTVQLKVLSVCTFFLFVFVVSSSYTLWNHTIQFISLHMGPSGPKRDNVRLM